MFTFYQSFIVSVLRTNMTRDWILVSLITWSCSSVPLKGELFMVRPFLLKEEPTNKDTNVGWLWKATEFWTATNIADGLNALTICIEVRLTMILGGAVNKMKHPRWCFSRRSWCGPIPGTNTRSKVTPGRAFGDLSGIGEQPHPWPGFRTESHVDSINYGKPQCRLFPLQIDSYPAGLFLS